MREYRERLTGLDCEICQRPMAKPHDDEDPKTNEARGWLCQDCNIMLGRGHDDPATLEAGAIYLRKYSQLHAQEAAA
jgi:hypothetical protein